MKVAVVTQDTSFIWLLGLNPADTEDQPLVQCLRCYSARRIA
jgi:hypothetical protein